MAKHYKILEKAKLTRDLFGGDEEWEVDVAPEDGQESDEMPSAEALFDPQAADGHIAEERPVVQPAAHVEPGETWNEKLAEILDAPGLAQCSCLGVCPARRSTGSVGLTAALAQWTTARTEGEVLLLEANGYRPRLSRVMQGRQRGLTEVLFEDMPLEEALTEWEGERLRLLPLGRAINWSRRRALPRLLAPFVAELRKGYPTLLVELPGADDRLLPKLPVAEMVDAVILLADPRGPIVDIENAAKTFAEIGVSPAACLTDSGAAASHTTRMDRLERQLRSGGRRRSRR